MPRLGVYIHWPFCRSKCPYCDFFSRVKKDVDQAAIVDGYLADLEYYRGLNDGYTVDSVFFGGGTPSLLEPKQIARILDKIAALWPLSEQPEISLEANPNTDRPGLFADLRAAGINYIIAVDGNEDRLKIAEKLGAKMTICFKRPDEDTLEKRVAKVKAVASAMSFFRFFIRILLFLCSDRSIQGCFHVICC